jgi:uncharacterized membrane protein
MWSLPIDWLSKAGNGAHDKREDEMNLYDFITFLHVAAAMVWIGAGSGMLLLGNRALKAGDEADLASVMRHLAYFSRVVFMPASVAVLVFGLYLTWYAGSFFAFWVIFGIVGMAGSVALGSMILAPLVRSYAALDISSGPTPESSAMAERIIAVMKANFVILFAIVFDMVVRPGWSNFITWIVLLLVVAAGIFFFMPRDLLPMRPGTERTREFTADDEDDDDK